jgi:hypothetical protein
MPLVNEVVDERWLRNTMTDERELFCPTGMVKWPYTAPSFASRTRLGVTRQRPFLLQIHLPQSTPAQHLLFNYSSPSSATALYSRKFTVVKILFFKMPDTMNPNRLEAREWPAHPSKRVYRGSATVPEPERDRDMPER